ncbi:synaptotagmin-like protein 5 isoform X1 [Pomacea canaliculata]|uniref:synaptotagmin-like protein 5 isoform X1 n=1 Tax=Pomacea canaliculata TaxID=400727 RepID=UPI000D739669|nr:synaptotagmin-like protein 5 isoform X1 [Pomacea canaliculata]
MRNNIGFGDSPYMHGCFLSLGFPPRDKDVDSRESLASVYSNAGEINYGRIPVTGDIVFGLDYDHRHSVLKIDVRNCQNIAPVDTKHNRSDPYVKVYLLPDKTRSGKRKTKIKKHTLNPVFNEVLTYNISRGELENRTLWVTVWHSDRFGRNDFLGEVLIAMDTYRFDDPSPCAYSLQSRAQESVGEAMQYKGELSLSLMYVTPEKVAAASQKSKSKLKKSKSAAEPMGEIHVMIKSASNLTAVRSNGTSDPFVKGYLLPDRARNGKQKTPVVKNTVNPSWSHILVFDGITPEEIPERSLELTVWDHEKLGTNEFLGGVRLNTGLGVAKGLQVDWMDARGEEAMAWQAIMERHNVWIDARLPLRASMGKPSKK